MDPTATLSEIRYLIKAWQSGNTTDPTFYADELTTHVQNLDEWITKGGHLPTPWPPAVPVRSVRRRRALAHPPNRRN